MKVSLITVNYNTHKHLQKLLESIYAYPPGFDYEIIIVDNNSPDRGIVELATRFSNAKFLFLETNMGFGYGCNQGAKISNGDYLAFINPDISFVGNSLENMVNFMDSNLKTACTTGLLMNDDKVLQYCFNDFPDFKWVTMEAFGLGAEEKVKRMLEKPEIINGIPFEIDWAHGACLVVRRNVFFELNGFDENIFLYYEDVDIQKRIKDKGYAIFCLPSELFYHYERSSVRDNNSLKKYHFFMHKSKIYYMKKHFNPFSRIILRLFHITGYLSRFVTLPLRKKFKNGKTKKIAEYFIVIGVHSGILRKI